MSASTRHEHEHEERVALHALRALSSGEVAEVEAQLAACAECRRELEALRGVVASFVAWPTDVLRPPMPLWDRLAHRIATETGEAPLPAMPRDRVQPAWEQVAPGISVQVLAVDEESARVTMLVRLAPDTDYPPHLHAGTEELHLLDGELTINDRVLRPGDSNRAEQGTEDHRVWSGTGCTCVLMTSLHDRLR